MILQEQDLVGEICEYHEYTAEVTAVENGRVYVELLDGEYEGQVAQFVYRPSDWAI